MLIEDRYFDGLSYEEVRDLVFNVGTTESFGRGDPAAHELEGIAGTASRDCRCPVEFVLGGCPDHLARGRHQRLDRRDKIVGDRAADAAIGQFHDIFRRAIRDRAAFQDLAIHADIAELVDDHRQPTPIGICKHLAD